MTVATTDENGVYYFESIADGSYQVVPTEISHRFTPLNAEVALIGGGPAQQDFAAAPLSTTPVTTPFTIDLETYDKALIERRTDMGYINSQGIYQHPVYVANPNTSHLSAWGRVMHLRAESPENVGCNPSIYFGGPLDLSNGLRAAAWIYPGTTSVWVFNPFYFSNGKPSGSGRNVIYSQHNDGQGQPYTAWRAYVNDVDMVDTAGDSTTSTSSGGKWNLYHFEINFTAGTARIWQYVNNGSLQASPSFSFTPFTPPNDLCFWHLGNPGSTSTWAPVIALRDVWRAGLWVGSLSDAFPATVNGSAKFPL